MDEMKTVIGVFDTFSQAQDAVEALLLRKYDRADISVVASEPRRSRSVGAGSHEKKEEEDIERPSTGTREVSSASASGMLGLIASSAALTLPGVGPILAAGPLLGLLTGATAGAVTDRAGVDGLVSALRQVGAPEEDARVYTDIVRDGGALVIVRTLPRLAPRIAALLQDVGHVDINRVRRRAVPGNYPTGGLGGDRSAAE